MPADPSVLQSVASRANGAMGHGPVSEDGKARSAQNARRHGLCSHGFELRDDERDLVQALEADHAHRYAIVTADGLRMASALARTELLQNRLDEIEMMVMNLQFCRDDLSPEERVQELRGLPSFATLVRYRARLERREHELRAQLLDLRDELALAADLARQDEADLAEPRMFEPEPEGSPRPGQAAKSPVNRHERRRQEALARKQATAA